MLVWFVIAGFAVVLGGALALILLRDEEAGVMETVGWGIPLGLGLISLSLLVLDLLGVSYARWTLLTCWIVAAAALIAVGWHLRLPFRLSTPRLFSFSMCALATVSGVQLLYAFVIGALWPIWEFDERAHWALKAKSFVLHARIDFDGFYAHNLYPLLDPLLQAARHIIAGGYAERGARALFPLFLVAIALILVSTFKRWGLPPWARWGLPALYLTYSPDLTWASSTVYADIPLACYVCGAGASLMNWLREPAKARWMVMSGVFLGAGVFTKLEGTMYALLFASVAGVLLVRDSGRLSRKIAHLGTLIGPSIVMFGLWSLWMWLHGVPAREQNLGWPHVERLGLLLRDFLSCLVNLREFGFLWIFLALLLALKPAVGWRRETIAAALLSAGGTAFAYGALLCTNRDFAEMIVETRSRLLAQNAPLLVLLAGQLILSFSSNRTAAGPEPARSAGELSVWGLTICLVFQVVWLGYVEVQAARRTYAVCVANGTDVESALRSDPDWPLVSVCKSFVSPDGKLGVGATVPWKIGHKLRYYLFPRPCVALQGSTLGSLLKNADDRGIFCVVLSRGIISASEIDTLVKAGWSVVASTEDAIVLKAGPARISASPTSFTSRPSGDIL